MVVKKRCLEKTFGLFDLDPLRKDIKKDKFLDGIFCDSFLINKKTSSFRLPSGINKKPAFVPAASELRRVRVELEGFEPSSRQGHHKLSTCLFLLNCRMEAGEEPTNVPSYLL